MPLHPSMVHLPLGLALLAPLLALFVVLAYRRGVLPKRAFWALIGTQALLAAGAFVAFRTGHAEEETVERLVPHGAIHAHEEAAELFLWAAFGALAISLAVAVIRSDRIARPIAYVATLAAFVVAGLGVNVGRAGGELVYVHGAAASYAKAPADQATAPATLGEGEHERGEDDDD